MEKPGLKEYLEAVEHWFDMYEAFVDRIVLVYVIVSVSVVSYGGILSGTYHDLALIDSKSC